MEGKQMTCIVGLETKDGVFIGGDNAGMIGWETRPLFQSKVFFNGPLLIGVCGKMRLLQVLRYVWEVPLPDPADTDYGYLCRVVVPNLRAMLEQQGYTVKEQTDGEPNYLDFLFGYQGRLYGMDSNFSVMQFADGFDAMGNGRDYALGALVALGRRHPMPARERVEQALAVAAHLVAGVEPPFTIEFQVRITREGHNGKSESGRGENREYVGRIE
jgi:hypothetical protein